MTQSIGKVQFNWLMNNKSRDISNVSFNALCCSTKIWEIDALLILLANYTESLGIPVNPPPFSRESPAWTGSHARETLISRTHLFFPPIKKSSTIKSWPTFCDQYFWKFPIWNFRADEKRREIRTVKVFKWYPVIDLFDTFTGKLGPGD